MNPTPIPDDEVWEGHDRLVVGPPLGHDATGEIRPIEALTCVMPETGRLFSTRWVPTAREIERLAAGEPIWVTQWTNQMVPFDVAMTEETS